MRETKSNILSMSSQKGAYYFQKMEIFVQHISQNLDFLNFPQKKFFKEK